MPKPYTKRGKRAGASVKRQQILNEQGQGGGSMKRRRDDNWGNDGGPRNRGDWRNDRDAGDRRGGRFQNDRNNWDDDRFDNMDRRNDRGDRRGSFGNDRFGGRNDRMGGPPDRGMGRGNPLAKQVSGLMNWIRSDLPKANVRKAHWNNYKAEDEDIPSRIGNYANHLNECYEQDDVRLIEDTLEDGFWHLVPEYKEEVVHRVANKNIFSATFHLSGVFLARSVGGKTKVKNLCYQQAVRMLRTKSIPQLMNISDVSIDIIRADFKSYFDPEMIYFNTFEIAQSRYLGILAGEIKVEIPDPNKPLTDEQLVQNLTVLAASLRRTKLRDNILFLLDTTSFKKNLPATCVIRILDSSDNAEQSIVCDLFFDKLLVSRGRGNSRKTAQAAAYEDAYTKILNTAPEDILENSKEIEQEELQVKMLEVWHKSHHHKSDSNIERLKAQKKDPLENEKPISEVVVVESSEFALDRKKNALHILTMTATWNGFMLEWSAHEEENNMHRYVITLQQEKIGEAVSFDKTMALNAAAVDALYHLYDKHPCFQVSSQNTSNLRSFKDIQDAALKLKNDLGLGDDTDDMISVTPDVFEKSVIPEPQLPLEGDIKEESNDKPAETNGQLEEKEPAGDDTEKEQPDKTEEDEEVDPLMLEGSTAAFLGMLRAHPEKLVEPPPEIKSSGGKDFHKFNFSIDDRDNPDRKNMYEPNYDNDWDPSSKYRINKYRKMVIEDIVESHVKSGSLDDLMFKFAPGHQTSGDVEQLKMNAMRFGLDHKKERLRGGDLYYKVFWKSTPQEIVEALKNVGPTSGRYTSMARSDLPSLDEIKVMKEEVLKPPLPAVPPPTTKAEETPRPAPGAFQSVARQTPYRNPHPRPSLLGSPQQSSGPPRQFSGPPQQFSGPSQRFSGPSQRFSGPSQRFSGPNQQSSNSQNQTSYPPPQRQQQQQQQSPVSSQQTSYPQRQSSYQGSQNSYSQNQTSYPSQQNYQSGGQPSQQNYNSGGPQSQQNYNSGGPQQSQQNYNSGGQNQSQQNYQSGGQNQSQQNYPSGGQNQSRQWNQSGGGQQQQSQQWNQSGDQQWNQSGDQQSQQWNQSGDQQTQNWNQNQNQSSDQQSQNWNQSGAQQSQNWNQSGGQVSQNWNQSGDQQSQPWNQSGGSQQYSTSSSQQNSYQQQMYPGSSGPPTSYSTATGPQTSYPTSSTNQMYSTTSSSSQPQSYSSSSSYQY